MMPEFFRAVHEGERRYVDGTSQDPHLVNMQLGTSLKAQKGPITNRLSAYIMVEPQGSNSILPISKSTFLSQPPDERTHHSAEEMAEIAASESARSHHIWEISRKMCEERAEEVIAAVLAALHSEDDHLPKNPFRKTDSLKEAVVVVKAADLKSHLVVPHIPHTSDDGDPGHGAYRKNIRRAVRRLMGIEK